MLAAADHKNLPPKAEKPAASNRIAIESWREEAFQVSLQTVRDLSSGVLKRDPAVRPPKPLQPKTPALRPSVSRKLTRWELDMQKRAALTEKTIEQIKEEERIRGQERRRRQKEERKTT